MNWVKIAGAITGLASLYLMYSGVNRGNSDTTVTGFLFLIAGVYMFFKK